MKNIKKIILSLVLAGAFLISAVPAQAATQETQDITTVPSQGTLNPLEKAEQALRDSVAPHASGPVDIAETHTWAFTGRSTPELICPQMDADTISLWATCEGDTTDIVTFVIQGNGDNNKSFREEIAFVADGQVHTFAYVIPADIYKANFKGDSSIKKTYAQAVLTVID